MVRKRKKEKKTYKAQNLPPGSIIYKGTKATTETKIEIFNYNSHKLDQLNTSKVEDAFHFTGADTITWINVNGLSNTSEIEKLGEHYEIHPLVLEDIVNTTQRPKIDEFAKYIFVAFKMLYLDDKHQLMNEHVSIIAGNGFVLSFQEADGDVFDNLRERINNGKGRIRGSGADYLAYAIMDAVVDNYFSVIEALGDHIEELEIELFEEDSNSDLASEIQRFKRVILKVRRAIFPFREVVNRLEKIDHHIVEDKTQNYIKDLYDHVVQVTESIDLYREMVWGLMDMHMNLLSHRMNEVMKVLTIIATIFIPLTFIAGIYGMNFENIPELNYKYGYFVLLGVMAVIFIFMLFYFRRKKWL